MLKDLVTGKSMPITRYQKRCLLLDLKAIHKTITKGWTRGEFARDRHGRDVETTSPKACRWCLLGAIHKEQLPDNRKRKSTK